MNASLPAGAARPPNYDRLARPYRALEFLAFGRDLERARFCNLDRLGGCRNLLVLGEGDGRCLARTLELWREVQVTCVDASSAMLRRAAGRLDGRDRARVYFVQSDARDFRPAPRSYDGILTLFFLDGFTNGEVRDLIERVRPSLRADALWLVADFASPPRGLARWRARAWLAVLYRFFRWTTGLRVCRLPATEILLAQAGFRCLAERTFQWGLIRSSVFGLVAPGVTIEKTER